MVTITIQRRAKLEKPMGIGEGRISEGTLVDTDWGVVKTVSARELGLRSITNIVLTMGSLITTAVGTPPMARILSPGSFDNTVRIQSKTGSYPLNYVAVGF